MFSHVVTGAARAVSRWSPINTLLQLRSRIVSPPQIAKRFFRSDPLWKYDQDDDDIKKYARRQAEFCDPDLLEKAPAGLNIPSHLLDRNPRWYIPSDDGEILDSGRYKVHKNLHWAKDGLTVLAHDRYRGNNVRIKIFKSGLEYNNRELAGMRRINANKDSIPGSQYVLPLRSFQIEGHRAHDCIVSLTEAEPVAKVLYDCTDDASSIYAVCQIGKKHAKRIALQATMGLAFLHRAGIGHGGLSIDKLNFHDKYDPDMTFETLNELRVLAGRQSSETMPRYIYPSRDWAFAEFDKNIRIDGLQNAFCTSEELCSLDRPHRYDQDYPEAPEIVKKHELDYRVDLWDLGFLIWELFAGTRIFHCQGREFIHTLSNIASSMSFHDEHLSQGWQSILEKTFGDEPDDKSKLRSRVSLKERNIVRKHSGSVKELFKKSYKRPNWINYYSSRQLCDSSRESDYYDCQREEGDEILQNLKPGEVEIVGDIIASLIKVDPLERAEAIKILENDWWCTG